MIVPLVSGDHKDRPYGSLAAEGAASVIYCHRVRLLPAARFRQILHYAEDDKKGRYCCEIVLFSFLDAYGIKSGMTKQPCTIKAKNRYKSWPLASQIAG